MFEIYAYGTERLAHWLCIGVSVTVILEKNYILHFYTLFSNLNFKNEPLWFLGAKLNILQHD